MTTRVASADGPLAIPQAPSDKSRPAEAASAESGPAVSGATRADRLDARPFEFTGSTGEYFRIWIVNLALSVVTLGLYSAWAKVRRLRYFYGHTKVDGHAFGYHAAPISILKGRLVAYAVVGVLGLLGQVSPLLALLLYVPLLLMMPFVIVRGLRFHARNSSYRGIRFGFDGATDASYAVFLGLPALVPFTFGLIYPYVVKRQREYVVNNSHHGRSRFVLSLDWGRIYGVYVMAVIVGISWMCVVMAPVVVLAVRSGPNREPPAVLALMPLLFYAGFGAVAVGVRTVMANLVWNNTTIDGHAFSSRLRVARMLVLYATNLVAIAGTLGFAVPWARIRLARYRAESLQLLPGGPLVACAAPASGGNTGAAASEFGEAMEFDVGL